MILEMLSSAKTIRDGLQTILVILRDRRITSKHSSAHIYIRKPEKQKHKNMNINNQNLAVGEPEGPVEPIKTLENSIPSKNSKIYSISLPTIIYCISAGMYTFLACRLFGVI